MPISVQEHPDFTAELLDLAVKKLPDANFLSLEVGIRLVNRKTGASSVMKFGDLPKELAEDLRQVLAQFELVAIQRFFGDIQ